MSTLIEIINSQFGVPATSPGKEKVASAVDSSPDELEEFEKVASLCDYVAKVGVGNIVKTAGAHDPSNNAGRAFAPRMHTYNQSTPAGSEGSPETNAGKLPGGTKGAYTKSGGKSHHPGLASNAAAIAVTTADHSRLVSPDLKRVLKNIPFSDKCTSYDLKNAKKAGEPNIHSGKTKMASDSELLKQAIAFKLAAKQNGES